MTTEIVLLDGDEVRPLDITSITNELAASGYHLHDAITVLTGFVSASHTIAVVTTAATVAALDLIGAGAGYALWELYGGTPEIKQGYLTITDADGKLLKVSAAGALSSGTTTVADFKSIVIEALNAITDADFVDTDAITTAVTTAKDKIKFEAA